MKRVGVCLLMVWVCSCRPVAEDPIDPLHGEFAVGPFGSEDNTAVVINGRHFKPIGSPSWQADARVIIKHYELQFDIIRGPLSIAEAGEELDDAARGLKEGRTYKGPTWERLKAEVKKGARLYFCMVGYRYSGYPLYRGWEGYVTVRGGKVTGDLRTRISRPGSGMPADWIPDEFK